MENVTYNFDEVKIKANNKELIDRAFTLAWNSIIKNDDIDTTFVNDVFNDFVFVSAFLKHQGFSEAEEARMIFAPVPETLSASSELFERKNGTNRKIKKILQRNGRNDKKLSYIEVFSGIRERLPIRRIIVGPGLDQDERENEAIRLVDREIPVVKSKTPFIS